MQPESKRAVEADVWNRFQVLWLGVLLFLCPSAFLRLTAKWYPAESGPNAEAGYHAKASILRRRFWGAAGTAVGIVALILSVQGFWKGALPVTGNDWFRVIAVVIALTAAIGRGGWEIQTWGGKTVIERIDRGTYMPTFPK